MFLTQVCVVVADYTINYVTNVLYHKQEQVTPVYRVEVNSSGGYSIWRKSAKIKYWFFSHKVNTAYNFSFSWSMAAADIAQIQIAVTTRLGKKTPEVHILLVLSA